MPHVYDHPAGNPGPEAPPPPVPGAPEAGPSPDDVMAAQDQEQQARAEAVAASAQQPEKAYSMKLMDKVVKALNDFIGKIQPELPEIELDLPAEAGDKWSLPLPPGLFVPLFYVMEAISQTGIDKHVMDPTEIKNDAGLRKMSAVLQRAGKDKKLVKIFSDQLSGSESQLNDADETASQNVDQDDSDEAVMRSM